MDEPIIIQKNQNEQVRVSLNEFKGKRYIDIRNYYLADDDEYRPTKKGVTLTVELYSQLRAGIEKLEEAL